MRFYSPYGFFYIRPYRRSGLVLVCRFYFISTEELLAILGGGNPLCIQGHMNKVSSTHSYEYALVFTF